jgi:PIN domain nuclease of toxin-antitoxin system
VRFLLDTHVWLWSRLEPERLAGEVARDLADPGVELWLSPISVWELLMLIERGRVSVDAPAREWVEAALRSVPMRDAAVTREVALVSRSIAVTHDDPADRFLAATALVYDLTLLTADRRLLQAEGLLTRRAN